MIERIVYSTGGVTILGGGEAHAQQILESLDLAPDLVAADGGADRALAMGLTPSAVIGDFDSISQEARSIWPQEIYHQSADQKTTDFEKCLAAIDAPGVIAHGVLGPRVDHGLAAMSTLMATSRLPVILMSSDDLVFHCPTTVTLDLPIGARVSLFPLARVEGRSSGLEWPINGISFAPGLKIGTSNRMATARLTLEFDGPGMLVLLEPEHLPMIWAALTA